MPEKYSRFRNSSNQRLLEGLFIETRRPDNKTEPLYTLRDWDHTRPNGNFLPSLYLKYMLSGDLTEYIFANDFLDGWEHWNKLCECPWFIPYLTRWREELSLSVKARALQRLREAALDPSNKSYVEINKYLANEAWRPAKARGRPLKDKSHYRLPTGNKEEKKGLEADYERVFGIISLPNNEQVN